jgi:hypothetical protein
LGGLSICWFCLILASKKRGRKLQLSLGTQLDVFLAPAENNSSVHLIKKRKKERIKPWERSSASVGAIRDRICFQLNYYCGHSYKKREGGEKCEAGQLLGSI